MQVSNNVTKNVFKFCAVLFDTCSVMMIPCGLKNLGILTVKIYYKYLKKNVVHFVVECCELVIDSAR